MIAEWLHWICHRGSSTPMRILDEMIPCSLAWLVGHCFGQVQHQEVDIPRRAGVGPPLGVASAVVEAHIDFWVARSTRLPDEAFPFEASYCMTALAFVSVPGALVNLADLKLRLAFGDLPSDDDPISLGPEANGDLACGDLACWDPKLEGSAALQLVFWGLDLQGFAFLDLGDEHSATLDLVEVGSGILGPA